MSFLTDDIMKGTDWRAVERAVARAMSHCGWQDVVVDSVLFLVEK
ncbi:hypothetical protein ACFL09_04620 [Planctomycetota bacterium]